jgi:hypothetical protein
MHGPARILLVLLLATAGAARAQRLNEILYDPHPAQPPAVPNGDANGDGFASASQDEFVEIYNHTAAAIDLSGWTLADELEPRHVFPAGTVLPPRCVIVVFGGGTPAAGFGAAIVQTASSGALMLNNIGDTVNLRDAAARLVATYTFRTEGSDESLTRYPDGSDLEPLVPHTTTGGVGVHSPGTQVDGTAFPGCSVAVARVGWTRLKWRYR